MNEINVFVSSKQYAVWVGEKKSKGARMASAVDLGISIVNCNNRAAGNECGRRRRSNFNAKNSKLIKTNWI